MAVSQIRAAESPNETVNIGVMGVNGRGRALARGFAQQTNCHVSYVCDVDDRAIAGGQKSVEGYQKDTPKGVADYRTMLDDDNLDVLVVATPNHWHAPATILGCKAGKHVYVEKPCSHNPEEGEIAVAASRKYDRVVQMGSQRRSRQPIVDAIKQIHAGEIGKVLYSRCWYNNRRGGMGVGKETAPPEWLDYTAWQGPAPDRPYKDNMLHYNWHWRWDYGNGELGNNGIHALDVARWGLQADYPTRITSAGGRYRYEDDQETPDTHMVCYEFGDKMITWEGLSWSVFGHENSGFGVTFHGDKGTMVLLDSGSKIYDMRNKEVSSAPGGGGDADHFLNFLTCVREGGRPNADIEEGHKSTLLCHLGNIAERTGRTITTDPKTGRIQNDKEAAALWTREYRPGFKPTV